MTKQGSFLGSLLQDSNGVQLQITNSFTNTDNSASPQASPINYDSNVLTIVPPDNAVECILNPTTDLRVSSLADISAYDIILAGTKESLPVGRMAALYVKQDSANGILYIRFTGV